MMAAAISAYLSKNISANERKNITKLSSTVLSPVLPCAAMFSIFLPNHMT